MNLLYFVKVSTYRSEFGPNEGCCHDTWTLEFHHSLQRFFGFYIELVSNYEYIAWFLLILYSDMINMCCLENFALSSVSENIPQTVQSCTNEQRRDLLSEIAEKAQNRPNEQGYWQCVLQRIYDHIMGDNKQHQLVYTVFTNGFHVFCYNQLKLHKISIPQNVMHIKL